MTKPQIHAAINATLAVAEAIRELGEVPAGHLYAGLISVMDLTQFDSLIAILCRAGVVERTSSHLLKWIGPKIGGVK